MSTDADFAASDGRDFADFTALDGIGDKTAEALYSAGITTMAQLAKSNVDRLVTKLEQVGSSVPASRIISQRWLFQAWEQRSGTQGSGVPNTTAESAGTSADVDQRPDPDPEDLPWVEHATFIVCFDRRGNDASQQWQTRVWDTTAMAEELVAGIDPDDWVELITERADVPF